MIIIDKKYKLEIEQCKFYKLNDYSKQLLFNNSKKNLSIRIKQNSDETLLQLISSLPSNIFIIENSVGLNFYLDNNELKNTAFVVQSLYLNSIDDLNNLVDNNVLYSINIINDRILIRYYSFKNSIWLTDFIYN